MRSVRNLQLHPLYQPSLEEKLKVKSLGPGRSELSTKSDSSSCRFNKTWYPKYTWLTGCGQFIVNYTAFLAFYSESLIDKELGTSLV